MVNLKRCFVCDSTDTKLAVPRASHRGFVVLCYDCLQRELSWNVADGPSPWHDRLRRQECNRACYLMDKLTSGPGLSLGEHKEMFKLWDKHPHCMQPDTTTNITQWRGWNG